MRRPIRSTLGELEQVKSLIELSKGNMKDFC